MSILYLSLDEKFHKEILEFCIQFYYWPVTWLGSSRLFFENYISPIMSNAKIDKRPHFFDDFHFHCES